MSEQQIAEIEVSIEEAKEVVELGKALDRLTNNQDFKLIIREGYLRDEAVRLVHLKGDPNMQGESQQRNIDRDIMGIGSLLSYFRKIQYMSAQANSLIAEGEQTIEELRSEGVTH